MKAQPLRGQLRRVVDCRLYTHLKPLALTLSWFANVENDSPRSNEKISILLSIYFISFSIFQNFINGKITMNERSQVGDVMHVPAWRQP